MTLKPFFLLWSFAVVLIERAVVCLRPPVPLLDFLLGPKSHAESEDGGRSWRDIPMEEDANKIIRSKQLMTVA